MLFPHKRIYDLFRHIKQNQFSSSEKLSSLLNVSERTIRSDIAVINDILSDYGAAIFLKRRRGYYLEITSPSSFSVFMDLLSDEPDSGYSLDSQESRISHLIRLLLNTREYLAADFLAQQIYISRITLSGYLKTVSADLEPYCLELISKSISGYKVIGQERNKRSCLFDQICNDLSVSSLTDFTREESLMFPNLDLMYIKSVFSRPLTEREIRISDLNLKKLVLLTAVTISRIRMGFYITIPEDIAMNASMEAVLNFCLQQLEESFEITFPADEKKYIYLYLASGCDYPAQIIDPRWLEHQVEVLIGIIYKDFSIDLRFDNNFREDLSRHLHSILKSKALNITEKNPMLDIIRSRFPLPYEIALTSAKKALEGSGYHLTEDDIAYIALHIGAALERFLSGKREKKKALILCGLGLSAGQRA